VFKECFNGGVDSFVVQGRRHHLESGVQILLRAKREKMGVVPPRMTFWGYGSCKETCGEPIGQRYRGICLLQYFLLV